MSKQYQQKKPTGREYVDYAKQFCDMTMFYCMRLPQKWMPVFLDPLIRSAQEIEALTIRANRVYIRDDKMDPDKLLAAYAERIQILQRTIQEFAVYDRAFERLMSYVDISSAEKRRLKNIVLSILEDERKRDPALKEIEIRVVSRGTDMAYTTQTGEHRYQLKLTPRDRDRWLDLESESLKYIRERITNDGKAVSRLKRAC